MALRGQRLASVLFVLFFIVLAGLTLFSNTFQTAMLPKVTTERPEKKMLSHVIKGSGVLAPRDTTVLVSESGWKVAKVHIGNNDTVKKDQVLVTFDSSEAEQLLLDAEDQLKRMGLNREVLKEQFVRAQQEGNEESIRKAKRDLAIDQLDWDAAKRKIDAMRRDLSGKRTMKAPFSGRVTMLKAEEGTAVPQGGPVLSLVRTGEGFQFSFTTDADSADLLMKDEKVPVDLRGEKPKRLEGTIAEIKDEAVDNSSGGGTMDDGGGQGQAPKAQKTIVLTVSGDGILGGEQASVTVNKQAKRQGLVIRKALLKQQGSQSYVFVVRENKSSLGNTYTVQKANVATGEQNDDEIVILGGLSSEDEIISESSEPLQEGNRVRLQ